MNVYCGECGHTWALALKLPLPIRRAVTAMKGFSAAGCPECGSERVMMGVGPDRHTHEADDLAAWVASGDFGTSSLTITHVLGKQPRPDDVDTPRDPDDFGRCYRLLATMTAWRGRLPEVAKR